VYETVTETKPYTYQKLVSRTCDLCGRPAKTDGKWGDGGTYAVDETEVEVTVRQKDGANFPSDGSGTKVVVDLCPDCFKSRLVPWLRSQGAKIEAEEWDW
jgi:hypothetical protein